MHVAALSRAALVSDPAGGLLIAVGEFPRGPGFYFSILKLVFFLVAFVIWVFLCNAVQRDSDLVEMPVEKTNGLLLGAGVVSFVLMWICPSIWVTILVMTVLTVTCVGVYSYQRDAYGRVPFWRKFKKLFRSDD